MTNKKTKLYNVSIVVKKIGYYHTEVEAETEDHAIGIAKGRYDDATEWGDDGDDAIDYPNDPETIDLIIEEQ